MIWPCVVDGSSVFYTTCSLCWGSGIRVWSIAPPVMRHACGCDKLSAVSVTHGCRTGVHHTVGCICGHHPWQHAYQTRPTSLRFGKAWQYSFLLSTTSPLCSSSKGHATIHSGHVLPRVNQQANATHMSVLAVRRSTPPRAPSAFARFSRSTLPSIQPKRESWH